MSKTQQQARPSTTGDDVDETASFYELLHAAVRAHERGDYDAADDRLHGAISFNRRIRRGDDT